jgi:MoxR-like ATPase
LKKSDKTYEVKMTNDSNEKTSFNGEMAENIQTAFQLANRLKAEINKVIVGQKKVVDQILCALFSGGHVLIEGVPGLGKTLLVKTLAKAFSGKFSRIQFTPDLMPADICGHMMYHSKLEEFRLKKGPIFTNLLLADEISRASAKTQSALLEVMQEQQVTIEGNTLLLPPPFMTLATQNPLEQEGTYPLPESQLDRFILKIKMDYPDLNEEVELVIKVTEGSIGNLLNVENINKIMTCEDVVNIQKIGAQIKVDKRVVEYAVNIVKKTQNWPGIAIGAGPRGSISLIRVARAAALLAGRDFVTPDDIKAFSQPCLRHRISLTPALEIEGYKTDDVLVAILDNVTAPRV